MSQTNASMKIWYDNTRKLMEERPRPTDECDLPLNHLVDEQRTNQATIKINIRQIPQNIGDIDSI